MMADFEFVEFLAQSARVAKAYHRAAADGAAFGFHRMTGIGGQRHREAFAIRAQRIDRVLHRKRLIRRQPQAEGEHALGVARSRYDRRVADDFRLVGCRRPGDHDLRFGEKKRMRAIDVG